jgi:hypothetical protein
MASKNPPKPQRKEPAHSGTNEGEGNKTADRHYREATREFVNSPRGREEIERAGDVNASEEREIEQAEEQAKQRAREHDPQEVRNDRRPK